MLVDFIFWYTKNILISKIIYFKNVTIKFTFGNVFAVLVKQLLLERYEQSMLNNSQVSDIMRVRELTVRLVS